MEGSEVMLNGEWVSRDKAQVSVFDRGFIFGDGIYELVPAYGKKPFLADRHLDRLERNLGKVGMKNPLSKDQWMELLNEIASRQDFDEQRIYLQVTRGAAPRFHSFPGDPTPTYLVFVDQLLLPSQDVVKRGHHAISREDFRWQRGDIKSISLMAAVLSSEMAAQAKATETIFLRDGTLTEGASSNVLVVIGGQLFSPKVNNLILSGITLSFVEEIGKQNDHPLTYRDISEQEFRDADEIMITSSGKEILPITTLDDKKVNSGEAGPVFMDLWNTYRSLTNTSES